MKLIKANGLTSEMKRGIKSKACIKSHKACHIKERELKTTPISPAKQHGRFPPLRAQGLRDT